MTTREDLREQLERDARTLSVELIAAIEHSPVDEWAKPIGSMIATSYLLMRAAEASPAVRENLITMAISLVRLLDPTRVWDQPSTPAH